MYIHKASPKGDTVPFWGFLHILFPLPFSAGLHLDPLQKDGLFQGGADVGGFQHDQLLQLLGRQMGFTHGNVGGGLKYFLCSSLFGEMIQLD